MCPFIVIPVVINSSLYMCLLFKGKLDIIELFIDTSKRVHINFQTFRQLTATFFCEQR